MRRGWLSARYAATPNSWFYGSVLGEDIALGDSLELPFVKHVHGFIALNRPLCRGKRPKPQPRVYPPFHKPMILFNRIIQVLALPRQTGFWEYSVTLQGIEGRRIRRVLVHGDDARGAPYDPRPAPFGKIVWLRLRHG